MNRFIHWVLFNNEIFIRNLTEYTSSLALYYVFSVPPKIESLNLFLTLRYQVSTYSMFRVSILVSDTSRISFKLIVKPVQFNPVSYKWSYISNFTTWLVIEKCQSEKAFWMTSKIFLLVFEFLKSPELFK